MTVIVKHNKTNTITDWTQAYLNEQIALGNYPPGTVLADIVLPSDWNNDHTLTGVGTMAEQDANSVAITGGTINNTTIGATTATTGKFTSVTTPSVTATTNDLTLSAISTGVVNVNTVNGTVAKFSDNTAGFSAVNYCYMLGRNAGAPPRYWVEGADANINTSISSKGTGSVSFFTNLGTAEQARVSHTASAVNYVQVTGAATGGSPTITTQGSDSDVRLTFKSKGNTGITFQNSSNNTLFDIPNAFPAVNYFQPNPSVTTQAVNLKALGTDTNISMAFQPKGTGAIDLAAGSSGVNISNGGTVTAITRTVAGVGYTTAPTWSASAPTTAGGVTATGTTTLLLYSPVVNAGGTGYTVGNTLTIVGGTFTSAAQLTVTAVSSGVITAATIATGGTYTATPTYPASVTGGSGSGATFTLSAGINTLAIGNAGSGYIEQPTITFSGGGGSGAAAYASVGSSSIIRALSGGANGTQALSIHTSGGETIRITDSGGTNVNYWRIQGASTNSAPQLQVSGSDTNVSGLISSRGTGQISFYTNGFNQEQLRVSHTASAVNYVQVTGAATANPPVISAQGSDSTIAMIFQAKGGQDHRFFSNSGSAEQFRVLHTAGTIANQTTATGSATGVAPIFGVRGTDTNIDLALTPKGTGVVQFGTRTASADVAITGYIEIKDAGGTVRRLAVVG